MNSSLHSELQYEQLLKFTGWLKEALCLYWEGALGKNHLTNNLLPLLAFMKEVEGGKLTTFIPTLLIKSAVCHVTTLKVQQRNIM